MNKGIFVAVAAVLAIVIAALVPLGAQQPTPAPQAAPAVAAPPTAAPVATAPAIAAPPTHAPQAAAPAIAAPQAAQKPTPTPAPALTPPPAQKPTPTPAPAATPPGSMNTYPNVRIEVTITDQAGNGPAIKKTMSLVNSGRNGSVRSGVNVPTVQTTYGAAGSGGVNTIPITSYGYSTRGLNLDVREVYVSNATGLIHVWLSLEYNPVDEPAEKTLSSSTAPWANFSQSFTLDLENGRPLLVAQTSDPVPSRNRTLSVEVKATIVK